MPDSRPCGRAFSHSISSAPCSTGGAAFARRPRRRASPWTMPPSIASSTRRRRTRPAPFAPTPRSRPGASPAFSEWLPGRLPRSRQRPVRGRSIPTRATRCAACNRSSHARPRRTATALTGSRSRRRSGSASTPGSAPRTWASTSPIPGSGSRPPRVSPWSRDRGGGTSRPTAIMTSRRPARSGSRASTSGGRTHVPDPATWPWRTWPSWRTAWPAPSAPRRSLPDETAQDESDVRGPLGEAAHEVGDPLGPVGHVDAHPVSLPHQRLLQVPAHPEQHLHLPLRRPPVVARREILRLGEKLLVVGRDRRMEPVGEEDAHQLAVALVHLPLLGERHVAWLLIGSLHQPDLGPKRLQALQVGARAAEIRLQGQPHVRVLATDVLEQGDGRLGRRRVLHVDLHEVSEPRRLAHEAQ